MTAADAQVVLDAFEAFNSEGTEALLPFVHSQGEFITPAELASEPDTYKGHEGVRRYFDSFFEAMDEITIEPVAAERMGDLVFVEFMLRARGKSTGIEAEQHAFGAIRLREEQIFRMSIHATAEAARGAIAEGGG